MKVAVVGDAALGWRFAVHEQRRGGELLVATAQAQPDAPAEIKQVVYRDRPELEAVLEGHAPDATVVFAPRRGQRPHIGASDVLDAVDAVGGRVVVWGCATVYGWPRETNGTVLGEDSPLTTDAGLVAAVEMDAAARALAARRPEEVHLFRAGATLAGSPSRQIAALGSLRLVPTPGDRRHVQLLDLRDAVAVLRQACRGENPGVYNVAGDGIMRVEDACEALGRSAARMPRGTYRVASFLARISGRVESAADLVTFTGGTPILDNARLKTHFGFRPRYSTRQALAAARDGGRDAVLES